MHDSAKRYLSLGISSTRQTLWERMAAYGIPAWVAGLGLTLFIERGHQTANRGPTCYDLSSCHDLRNLSIPGLCIVATASTNSSTCRTTASIFATSTRRLIQTATMRSFGERQKRNALLRTVMRPPRLISSTCGHAVSRSPES